MGEFTARLWRTHSGEQTPDGMMHDWTDMGTVSGRVDGGALVIPVGGEKPWMGDRLEMLTGPLAGQTVSVWSPREYVLTFRPDEPVE